MSRFETGSAMRLGEINSTATRRTGLPAQRAEVAPAPESRALIAVTPTPASSEPYAAYRQAAFLAHLIATKDQSPQTRERRRAEPSEAIAAYRAAVRLTRRI